MSYWKHIISVFFFAALFCLSTSPAFAHDVSFRMNQQQVSGLYNKLTKEPSDKLVKMAKEMFRNRQEFDSAAVCLSVVINRYNDDLDKKEKAVCLDAFNTTGYICCYHYYDYTRAFDVLLKAKEIGEKYLPNDTLLCRTYLNCGNLLITSGLHYDSKNLLNSSIEYFKKSLHLSYTLKDWEIYVKAYFYISSLLSRRNDIEGLKSLVTEKEFKSVPTSTPNYKPFVNRYRATLCYIKGDYPAVRKFLQTGLCEDVKSNTPYRYKSLTYSAIAHVFEMENNLDSAMAYYNRVLDIAHRYKLVDVEAATYGFIANDYKMAKDEENYIKYYQRYAEVKDSLLTVNGLEDVGEKHFLTQVKQEADRADKLHQRNYFYLIFGLLLLTIAVISIIAVMLLKRKNKYLNERNKLLYERVHCLLDKDSEAASDNKKYQNSNLSEEEKQRLCKEINRVMQMTEEICKPTFTVEQMANLVGTNYRYISQVINECYGKNFSTLLADQRVKIACKYFDDVEQYGNLTIEAVAQNVGFRSRNSLITAFKRVTGLTPSEYQKMSRMKD